MSTYTPQYTRPYADGYKDRPDESTPEYARFINSRDDALLRIEAFLAALQIPEKLSELVNDEGFVKNTVSNLANYYLKSETYSKTETYTREEVAALIADAVSKVAGKLNISVVDVLPTSDISTTTFYLIPKETAQEKNLYDEYINTDGTVDGWEFIGGVSTSIDLSDYYKKSEVDALLEEKMNKADIIPSKFEGTKAVVGNQVPSGGGTYVVSDLDYSTEEQLTGRRWTDGKPIYQKNVKGKINVLNNSVRTVLTDDNIDSLVSCTGKVNYEENDVISIPSAYFIPRFKKPDVTIQCVQTGTASREREFEIIILYTKISDTASSPVALPKVEAMHVYSTEEKVVGTWIDGKTLYEKTVVYDGIVKTDTKIYQNESIDEIVNISNKCFYDTSFNKWNTEINSTYNLGITARGCYLQGEVNSAYGDRITKCRCTIQYTKTTDTATA